MTARKPYPKVLGFRAVKMEDQAKKAEVIVFCSYNSWKHAAADDPLLWKIRWMRLSMPKRMSSSRPRIPFRQDAISLNNPF